MIPVVSLTVVLLVDGVFGVLAGERTDESFRESLSCDASEPMIQPLSQHRCVVFTVKRSSFYFFIFVDSDMVR